MQMFYPSHDTTFQTSNGLEREGRRREQVKEGEAGIAWGGRDGRRDRAGNAGKRGREEEIEGGK